MVKDVNTYTYQSLSLWKHNEHRLLLKNSMIFNMTLKEYTSYISSDLHEDVLDFVYRTPKIIVRDGKSEVLTRRLETFFEDDKDINRNENIQRVYSYGYSKTEIATYIGLNRKSLHKILMV